jgi:general stress protein 26
MIDTTDLEGKFWEALESDKIVMLGIDGAEDGHTRPMTAQVVGREAPIWFFATRNDLLIRKLGPDSRATATFASKGHEIFAALQGPLSVEANRATVDRLWNRSAAAWYPLGKEDPTLVLLRFDAERAEIWRHESSVFAGMKKLLGSDARNQQSNEVAEIEIPARLG